MIVWNLTVFVFTHRSLRALSKGRNLHHINIHNIGYFMIAWSIFVTWEVIYTNHNSMEQAFLGVLLGITFAVGSAIYLEYYWSTYIPMLLLTPPFSWFSYVDSVYSGILCNCKTNVCRHKAGQMIYHYATNVYEPSHSQPHSAQVFTCDV